MNRPRLVAAAATLLIFFSSVWFIQTDKEPPSFDESWYLEVSCTLQRSLVEKGPLAYARAYADSFRFKAPLLAVLPTPAYSIAGRTEDAAFLINLLSLPITAIYLFLLGRRFYGERVAAIAVIAWLTMPLVFGLSRRFLVESWLTTCVAAGVFHLTASEGLRNRNHGLLFGIASGLGLLVKSLYPLYIIGPLWIAFQRRKELRGLQWKEELSKDLRPVLYSSIPIALTWYTFNGLATVGFMLRAGYGDIGAHYGTGPAWHPEVLFGFWMHMAHSTTSYYYAILFFGLIAIKRLRPAHNLNRTVLLLWMIIPWAFVSLGKANEVRYLAPCLPAFALLIAIMLERAPKVLPFVFIFPIVDFWSQTFSPLPAPFETQTAWSGIPRTSGRFGQEAFVDALAERINQPATVALGLEHRYFNANRLAAISACRGHDLRFVNYGHMESRVERIVARISDKDAGWLLEVNGLQPEGIPESAIGAQKEIGRLIREKALPFEEAARFTLENGASVLLLERKGPIKMMGTSIPALPYDGKLE